MYESKTKQTICTFTMHHTVPMSTKYVASSSQQSYKPDRTVNNYRASKSVDDKSYMAQKRQLKVVKLWNVWLGLWKGLLSMRICVLCDPIYACSYVYRSCLHSEAAFKCSLQLKETYFVGKEKWALLRAIWRVPINECLFELGGEITYIFTDLPQSSSVGLLIFSLT